MEHAFEFEDARPWRTAAIVASVVATAELVILIALAAIHLAKPAAAQHAAAVAVHRHRPPAVATKPKAATTPRPTILPRARTRVAVLNGNGQTGAAATEADALRARGYKINSVGNAPQSITGPSLVMYRPGFAAEGKRLAHDTGLIASAVNGLQPSLLGRAQVVILLGTS